MRYIPSTEEQKKEMLKEIGVSSFEDLIESVPKEVRFKRKLNIPEAISEAELEEKIYQIAKKNSDFFLMKPLLERVLTDIMCLRQKNSSCKEKSSGLVIHHINLNLAKAPCNQCLSFRHILPDLLKWMS